MKSIDLFAGVGGIRMGFERVFPDLETVFVSEWDKHAQKTYSANYPSPAISGDITQIPSEEIPSFDICFAGFPCQAFSMAGKRMGFQDNYKGRCRGTLFQEVVRICEYHKPKVIFCENVKGLVSHDEGRTVKIIIGALGEIGYNVICKVLNSKDFGVPQNRERIYLVCFRKDINCFGFDFPEPTNPKTCIRDIMDPNPVPEKYFLTQKYFDYLKKHREKFGGPNGKGFGYKVRSLDSKCGTLICGGMGRAVNLVVDKKGFVPDPSLKRTPLNTEDVRTLTPREWARLQSFPDSFILPCSDIQTYKQMGNSVTVNVIEAIARKIKDVLDDNHLS